MDSILLLYLSYFLFAKKSIIRIIYISHCYNVNSFFFFKFLCRELNEDFKISIYYKNIFIKKKKYNECIFRISRINIYKYLIIYNSYLFLGHHYYDILETFFLRLFRSSGILGLSCVKNNTKYLKVNIFRPFLNLKKDKFFTFIILYNIKYIYDISNKYLCYFRNFIREIFLYNIINISNFVNSCIIINRELNIYLNFLCKEIFYSKFVNFYLCRTINLYMLFIMKINSRFKYLIGNFYFKFLLYSFNFCMLKFYKFMYVFTYRIKCCKMYYKFYIFFFKISMNFFFFSSNKIIFVLGLWILKNIFYFIDNKNIYLL